MEYNNLKVFIIHSENKYELARTKRILSEMNIKQSQIVTADKLSNLNQIEEDYIAFYNTFDVWNHEKVLVCQELMQGKYDIILHSYIQHYGRKQYRRIMEPMSDVGQNMIEEIIVQGVPCISSIICKKEWLLQFEEMKEGIDISSREFHCLLENKLLEGNCRVGLAPEILAESWSKNDNNNYSVFDAKEYLLEHWKVYKEEIKARSQLDKCYNLFRNCFETDEMSLLFDVFEMEKQDIINYYEEKRREEYLRLVQQAKMTNKKNDFYIFMRNWVELHQSGKTMADVLYEMNIQRLAIYGAGKHGQMLLNELKDSQIEVVCWIDKNVEKKEIDGYPVCMIDNLISNLDAIIVTPYREFPEIKTMLEGKISVRIISLDELVGR